MCKDASFLDHFSRLWTRCGVAWGQRLVSESTVPEEVLNDEPSKNPQAHHDIPKGM